MGARYPYRVGGHKPCVPVVIVMLVDYHAPPCLCLISCSCIVVASCYFIMAQHIAFEFNWIKLKLNNCWLSHGATISI